MIDVDFKQTWYWFVDGVTLYTCPDKRQLEDFRDAKIVRNEPHQVKDKFRFAETFKDVIIGKKQPDAFSTLIAFETDGMGVIILDGDKELP